MSIICGDSADFIKQDLILEKNEKKTLWVVILTALMMVLEIISGYLTGSMALLADGWHMASHAGALGISFLAYRFAKSHSMSTRFSFGAGKLIPLGGYTSAVALALIAILMSVESIQRFFRPQQIQFSEAIVIAVLGLAVNIVSAVILGGQAHHHHEHDDHNRIEHSHEHHVHDHNLRSAYIHVLADAVTSVTAIIALTFGKFFNWVWLDALMGLIGSFVILKWAYNLCLDAGAELLDVHSKVIDGSKLKILIEEQGAELVDLHAWRVAPKAIACEVVVRSKHIRGAEHFRSLILEQFRVQHLVIEERMQ